MAKGETVAPFRDPAFADDHCSTTLASAWQTSAHILETDALHLAARKTTLPAMPFKIDLHTHSFFSGDGVSSPEENIASARAKGLHGFALTDHNTNDGITYLLDKGLMREDGSRSMIFSSFPASKSRPPTATSSASARRSLI